MVTKARSSVFLNYRSDDTKAVAARLAADLRRSFRAEQVFQDFSSIAPGAEWPESLEHGLENCAAVLVLIGRNWLQIVDGEGRRRLDLPEDWVRQEIATVLRVREVRVFPVLVDDASMPAANELPEEIRALTRRQAIHLTTRHWEKDVTTLVEYLRRTPGLVKRRSWIPHVVFALVVAVILAFALGRGLHDSWSTRSPSGSEAPTQFTQAEDSNLPGPVASAPITNPSSAVGIPSPQVDLKAAFSGFSCGVESSGGTWAEETRRQVADDLYKRYGCSEPSDAASEQGFSADMHTSTGSGPYRGSAFEGTVLYYSQANKAAAEAVARDLSQRYKHRFAVAQGEGQGIRDDWKARTIRVQLREGG